MHQPKLQKKPEQRENQLLSLNPNTGELLGSVPIFDEHAVRTAVARARSAQPAWAARSLQERIRIMQLIQETLVDHVAEIATLVSLEMGKTETDSLIGDALLVLTSLTGYLNQAPGALRTKRQRQGLLHSTKRTYIVREPLGVVAVISPFNFPVLLSLQSAFAALIAGNAVVHKPSEYAPLTALRIREFLLAAGLPPDLFQVVTGAGDTGNALVHAAVDHISFIGSSAMGRKVAAAAGEQLIPATLELGGNNAMIVLDDAPLPRAVHGALAWAYGANGQMCGAVSCLYVHKAIATSFIEQLQTQLAGWDVSTNIQPEGADVTALLSEEALARVENHVQEAVTAGAQVLCGGKRQEGEDAPLFPPTILINTTPNMSIMREETFGPVLCVMEVKDDAEAVALVNDSPYGLTASVWTRNNDRAWTVARNLNVATVAVNDHLWPFFAPEVPWGGIKASGLGRVGGAEGLQTMTYQKVISYDRLNLPREIYWFPRPKWLYFALLMLIPLLYSRRPRKRLKALFDLITGLVRKRT
jgi:acyl-CoA reductase-like NAD-dependent aldehyde dehydrogenase